MTNIEDKGAMKITPPAQLEPDISREHAYTDVVYVTMGSKKTEFSGTIASIIPDMLVGCGRVDLVSISCKIVCDTASQVFKMGCCEVGASRSATEVALKANGLYHVANNMTIGTEILRTLIPEDTLSKQIQPVSSFLPTTKLIINKTEGVVCSLEIRLIVHGIRTRYFSLN